MKTQDLFAPALAVAKVLVDGRVEGSSLQRGPVAERGGERSPSVCLPRLTDDIGQRLQLRL